MKKKTKVIMSLLLVISIFGTIISYMAFSASAATSGASGALQWSLSDDGVFTVSGTGYGDNYSTSTTNAPPWKDYRSSINTVVVNGGVQAIGDYWFYNCANITSVTLPSSLVKIGAGCFRQCTSLTDITIPENCCEYYNYTFYGCTSLKWAVLPRDNSTSSYLHKIPDNTFYGCTKLENVWVGEDYTAVGASAFRNCSKLSAVIWTGSSLTSVGSYFPSGASFVGSSSIESWCSSNGKSFINVTGSCGDALSYSYDLSTKGLSISGSGAMTSSIWNKWKYFLYSLSVTGASSICENAFSGCEYLGGSLDLPASVVTIGSVAFGGAGFNTVTINAESVSIGASAFDNAKYITFYGKHGSGAYDYVCGERTDPQVWKYYCISDHFYGDGGQCVYCDKNANAMNIEPLGDHNYTYLSRNGQTLYYKCSHCGNGNHTETVSELIADFPLALSSVSTPYQQLNYDGRFDINRDGFVNAKDYKLLLEMQSGRATDYDMNLVNANATDEAKAVFRYICSVYGNHIISGQQESTWMSSPDYEVNYIKQKTGKYPAIRGLDFMNEDYSGVVSRARSWADDGGIVTICWHCSSSFDGGFNESQSDTLTAAQWEAVLTDGTSEHAAFIQAMDKAGNALLQLQNDGIPVLWRPFHEFDGGWFWWGKGGSEYFKRLWIMMYNHFTYDLGLNNLIWVLGYCHNGTDYGASLADWYPGNQYCDIAGADSYEAAQNGAEARLFTPVYNAVNGTKPLVMHETGLIPTVEQFQSVPWAYFMTWHTTYVTSDNTVSHLQSIYTSDYVITRDELPDLYG